MVIDQPSTHTKQVIERDSKPVEDLKKHFLGKLQEQRVYLLGIVRDLERRTQNANLQTDLANIWERLNELGLLTGKKADAEDTRKNLVYL